MYLFFRMTDRCHIDLWIIGMGAEKCVTMNDTVCVTLDHKTSHKGQFFKIEIYTSSETE